MFTVLLRRIWMPLAVVLLLGQHSGLLHALEHIPGEQVGGYLDLHTDEDQDCAPCIAYVGIGAGALPAALPVSGRTSNEVLLPAGQITPGRGFTPPYFSRAPPAGLKSALMV